MFLKLIGDDDLEWTCSFCKQRFTVNTLCDQFKPSSLDDPNITEKNILLHNAKDLNMLTNRMFRS